MTVTNFAGSGSAEDDSAVATTHLAPIKVDNTLWLECGGGQPIRNFSDRGMGFGSDSGFGFGLGCWA
ncbi:hypothetical protein PIB30_046380 [Stylosanthes scabra]|uniref:Uncharacterized protein n=1 Tax=Stylosanthes scabra TaxID=79078 RepID=A0ABU6QGS1_9FABA|nr:hypothetical protein [Stylosanthes scabra]